MSLKLGSTSIEDIYLGSVKVAEAYLGSTKVYSSVDPYNPLGLPPYTIRCKFSSGTAPTQGDSRTLVDATENVWDITKNSTDWMSFFMNDTNLIAVLGANSTGVTSMRQMFTYCSGLTSVALSDTRDVTTMRAMFTGTAISSLPAYPTSNVTSMFSMCAGCTSLRTVPLFDTSSVTEMTNMFQNCRTLGNVPLFDTSSCTNMRNMFYDCVSLSSVPLFNTSSCTNMEGMFNNCVAATSGALALYQQASTQATAVTNHTDTFKDCGILTQAGVAELAQIPTDWGGTMSNVTYNIEFLDTGNGIIDTFDVIGAGITPSLTMYYKYAGSWHEMSSADKTSLVTDELVKNMDGFRILGIPSSSWGGATIHCDSGSTAIEGEDVYGTVTMTDSNGSTLVTSNCPQRSYQVSYRAVISDNFQVTWGGEPYDGEIGLDLED